MGSGNGLLNSLYRRVGMVARIHVLCVEMMAAVVVKSKSPASVRTGVVGGRAGGGNGGLRLSRRRRSRRFLARFSRRRSSEGFELGWIGRGMCMIKLYVG